jgi:hypothetical protein
MRTVAWENGFREMEAFDDTGADRWNFSAYQPKVLTCDGDASLMDKEISCWTSSRLTC